MALQEAAEGTGGWELGVTKVRGINGGMRLQGDQNIPHEEAEHGCTVYCDATDSGSL